MNQKAAILTEGVNPICCGQPMQAGGVYGSKNIDQEKRTGL
jgi:hypothetical protein